MENEFKEYILFLLACFAIERERRGGSDDVGIVKRSGCRAR